jgi:hypothetical protein
MVKLALLAAQPPGVLTQMWPLFAPEGTLAVTDVPVPFGEIHAGDRHRRPDRARGRAEPADRRRLPKRELVADAVVRVV